MELTQFISETLVSIVEGIADAQARTKDRGAFVNPGGLMRTTSSVGENSIWDNRTNNFARLVTFDIAVTVEEGTKTGAKIGVVAGLFDLGAGGASENKQLAMNRIQFAVPVLLPASELPPEARLPKKRG